VAGLGLVEALEYIPVANELANIADAFDFYIMAANQVIASGTSRKQFEAYFRKNFPELYAAAIGEGEVIDVKFEEEAPVAVPVEVSVATPNEGRAPLSPEAPEQPPESQ
jgi:hypothetical protein